ncbi:unnamed protein product [Trichogramma brassicae]|uniref:RING-type domain-containing protein n=1 Tax=Trichogramma brassicae TaxID=86971 RepID=A0A6H5ITS4_9HYME|nr:unnamed protein product [Trichogramma brassicae]
MELRPRRSVDRLNVYNTESDSDEEVVSATVNQNVSQVEGLQPISQPLQEAIARPSTAVDGPTGTGVNNSRLEGGSQREPVAAGPSGIFVDSESDSDQNDVQAVVPRSGPSHGVGPTSSRPLQEAIAPTENAPMSVGNNSSMAGPSNDAENGGSCSVCMFRPKTHCFVPCGHWTCCEWCAVKIMMGQKVCPHCRAKASCTTRVIDRYDHSVAEPANNDSINNGVLYQSCTDRSNTHARPRSRTAATVIGSLRREKGLSIVSRTCECRLLELCCRARLPASQRRIAILHSGDFKIYRADVHVSSVKQRVLSSSIVVPMLWVIARSSVARSCQ